MSSSRKSDQPCRSRDSHATRYAAREEQLRELLGHLRERDERVREALIAVLTGATPRLLAAVGTLVGFVGSRDRR
jgi:hypothetical protein